MTRPGTPQIGEAERQEVSRRALRRLPETVMQWVAYNAVCFLLLWGTGFLAFKAVIAGWGILMVFAVWSVESSRPSRTELRDEVPLYWHGFIVVAFQLVMIAIMYYVSTVITMGHLLI
jgi:hypothetical protein